MVSRSGGETVIHIPVQADTRPAEKSIRNLEQSVAQGPPAVVAQGAGLSSLSTMARGAVLPVLGAAAAVGTAVGLIAKFRDAVGASAGEAAKAALSFGVLSGAGLDVIRTTYDADRAIAALNESLRGNSGAYDEEIAWQIRRKEQAESLAKAFEDGVSISERYQKVIFDIEGAVKRLVGPETAAWFGDVAKAAGLLRIEQVKEAYEELQPFFTETIPGWAKAGWEGQAGFFTSTIPGWAKAGWGGIGWLLRLYDTRLGQGGLERTRVALHAANPQLGQGGVGGIG